MTCNSLRSKHCLKKYMKNHIKLAAVLVIFFCSTFAAFAAEENLDPIKADLRQQVITGGLTGCRSNLSKAFDMELYDYFKFLESNFQNKSANSSLSNVAIARYRDYKLAIEDLFILIKPVEGVYQQQQAAYLDCVVIKEEYLQVAKDKLISHIRKNSAQKKTVVLLEKYQAINSKLRDLNVEVAEMYGYFMTFKEKLPGFLRECIQNN